MELAKKIRELVGNNRISEIFQGYEHPELAALAGRHAANERDKRMNIVSYDTHTRITNQIVHAILSLDPSGWTIKNSLATVILTNNITVNFGEQLRTVESTQAMFAKLQRRLENNELSANEVKQASQRLYDLTAEEVFLDIIASVEKAERRRVGIKESVATAVADLTALEPELISFLQEQNQTRKEKSLMQLLSDFSAAPSEETYIAFQEKVTETFSSTAFYKPADRTALKALLSERPALSGFGYAVKVKIWVNRVQVWLHENYKA
jgi:hypothetical protein